MTINELVHTIPISGADSFLAVRFPDSLVAEDVRTRLGLMNVE